MSSGPFNTKWFRKSSLPCRKTQPTNQPKPEMAPPPEVQCKENGQTRSSQGWGHWPAPPPCWRTPGSTSERPPRRTKKGKSPLWFSQSEAWLCMREPQSDNSFCVGFASLSLPSPEGTGPAGMLALFRYAPREPGPFQHPRCLPLLRSPRWDPGPQDSGLRSPAGRKSRGGGGGGRPSRCPGLRGSISAVRTWPQSGGAQRNTVFIWGTTCPAEN